LPALVKHQDRKLFLPLASHHPTRTDELLAFEVENVLTQFACLVGVAVASEICNCNGAKFPNLGHHFPLCWADAIAAISHEHQAAGADERGGLLAFRNNNGQWSGLGSQLSI